MTTLLLRDTNIISYFLIRRSFIRKIFIETDLSLEDGGDPWSGIPNGLGWNDIRGGGITTSKAKRKSVFTYVHHTHHRALAMDTHDDDGRMTDEESQPLTFSSSSSFSLSLYM